MKNELINYFRKLRTESDFRAQEKKVILEGKNCILDVAARHKPLRVISTEPVDVPCDEFILIPAHMFKKISGVMHPEGMLAEFPMPTKNLSKDMKRVLVLDRIQDPGNLGTIIRTACAFSWDGILLLNGTCDPFNDKAMRAAKGATFEIAIQKGTWQDVSSLCEDKNFTLLVTRVEGIPIEKMESKGKILLVLGNEAQGVIIPPSIEHADVTIPMKGAMQSLNVSQACTIFMYELARRSHG